MLLIKLGGSVITHKEKPFSPNLINLYQIAKELSDYWQQLPPKSMMIVHGGGGFAHVVASQQQRSLELDSERKRAISLITWSARKLNDRVIESCVDYDLPVFPLQTSSMLTAGKKRLIINKALLDSILKNGWIPVLYGDIVPSADGGEIVSGEKIIETVCRDFDVDRILICTNVDGVLKDVNNPALGVVEKITRVNVMSVMRKMKGSSCPDVTGGMKEKVRILYRIATETGVSSQIMNGANYKRFTNAYGGTVP